MLKCSGIKPVSPISKQYSRSFDVAPVARNQHEIHVAPGRNEPVTNRVRRRRGRFQQRNGLVQVSLTVGVDAQVIVGNDDCPRIAGPPIEFAGDPGACFRGRVFAPVLVQNGTEEIGFRFPLSVSGRFRQ